MSLMFASALIGFVGLPYNSLLPIFASEIVGGGAKTLGSMMSSIGLGALAGAIFLTARFDTEALNRLFAFAVIGFGALLILFSHCHLLWPSLVLLLFIGFAQMVRATAGLTVVQTAIPDELRGRVLATNSMLSTGLPPFGALIGGITASHFGAPLTVAIGGFACILCGLFFYRQLQSNRMRAALSGQQP
jgi:predicted MFS family arabinose efflux permease